MLDGECGSKLGKPRYRQCLVPLMIPPPGTGQESRGAVLFRSLLRTPSSRGDDVPYTPPPMLSPVRPGSGLFSAVCAGTESDDNVLHCSKSKCQCLLNLNCCQIFISLKFKCSYCQIMESSDANRWDRHLCFNFRTEGLKCKTVSIWSVYY